MFNITVLTLCDRISLYHSLLPFFKNKDKRFKFTYTSDASWCLSKDTNQILIMVRQFIKPDFVDIELLTKLRNKYKKIAFFHDDAGGGIPRLEVLPFVDFFYTKAVFKDKSLYARQLYGKELYSDYFHTKYGVLDTDAKERAVCTDVKELAKIRVSWNIGIGLYPRRQLRQRVGVALARVFDPSIARFFYYKDPFNPQKVLFQNKGLYSVHARIGLIARPSISYQRKLFLDLIKDNPLFLTGRVSQKQFNTETKHSKIILSPFGWGELCLRDYEAVRSGALLLKPDMSHLETWPDIFIPFATYVPCNWEGTDIVQQATYYLEHEDERFKIAQEAARLYYEALQGLQSRFSGIMEEITG